MIPLFTGFFFAPSQLMLDFFHSIKAFTSGYIQRYCWILKVSRWHVPPIFLLCFFCCSHHFQAKTVEANKKHQPAWANVQPAKNLPSFGFAEPLILLWFRLNQVFNTTGSEDFIESLLEIEVGKPRQEGRGSTIAAKEQRMKLFFYYRRGMG